MTASISKEALNKVQIAFHQADEAGCTLEQCWQAAITALLESGEVVVANEAARTPAAHVMGVEEDVQHITNKWKEVKPSNTAQRLRSALLHELDSTDFMPDYVADVVDIAIQMGMNSTKPTPNLEAMREEIEGLREFKFEGTDLLYKWEVLSIISKHMGVV